MKKLYLRLLREIRNNYGQFVSIILVIAIGSMLLCGMFSVIYGINKSVDDYYKTQNLADIWGYYKGITKEEVAELAGQDGIDDAQGRYTFNANLVMGGNESALRIHSMTAINVPYVTSGSLPQHRFNCVLDEKYAKANAIKIGQKITLHMEDTELDLTVTGFCLDPEYAYKTKDATEAIVNNKTFGYAYAGSDTLVELNKHSEAYLTYQKESNEQISKAEEEISSAQADLDEKTVQFENGKSEAEKAFADGYKNLAYVKKELDDAQGALDAQQISFKEQTDEAQEQIDSAKKALDEGKAQLDAGYAQYQSIRDTLTKEEQLAQDAAWQAQYKELDAQYAKLDASQQELSSQLQQGLAGFAFKQSELEAKRKEYEENLAALKKKEQGTMSELASTDARLNKSQTQIDEKGDLLAESKTETAQKLEDISKNYQEVLFRVDDYAAAETSIRSNESYIAHIERENQSSYAMVNDSLAPIRTVSYVFPLIFFIVAAIIVFISMSKTVENQRTQVAVMQAIGISKGKIRLSFLSYALMCSLLGSVVFALIGYKIVPGILVRSFTSRFALPGITVPLNLEYIILPLIIAVVFSGAAAILATHRVLKEAPAQAMRPRPPKSSKKILVERIRPLWKRLGYSAKLIMRNIFLNKTRLVLSSVGIIGSVMLLITGLSLKYSAQTVIDSAMKSMSYDMRVTYSDPVEDKSSLSLGYPIDKAELTQMYNATLKQGTEVNASLQVIEENSTLVNLFDPKGKPLPIALDSVIIPQNMAEDYSLDVGETITVEINDKDYPLIITGIAVEYAGKSIYVSYPAAEAAGIGTASKSVLVSLHNAADTGAAAQAASSQDGVKSVNTKENLIQRSREMMGTLDAMILVIILSAAVLSVTVIYNIMSIIIFERTREFATLMVLGYYYKEVYRLMFFENMVTTGFGCVVGFPCGAALFQYIIGLVSAKNLTFPSTLNPVVILAAIAITFAFSIFANMLLKPKIRKIVLVEALKSVE